MANKMMRMMLDHTLTNMSDKIHSLLTI